MSRTSELLNQIIAAARARGMSQKDLAAASQIQPESISRAKKAGDIRLSTLEALAHVVGLKVALLPDEPLLEKIREGNLFE